MNLLKDIQDTHLSLPYNANEENIKIHVVISFLEFLGYKKSWLNFEEQLKLKNRTDIAIKIPSYSHSSLYVEVKRKNHIISNDDFIQLSNYLNINNITWGILTNGNEYYLLNNSVNGNASERYILEYKLIYNKTTKNYYDKKTNDKILKYFSYAMIFQKNATDYFKYYKNFKLHKLKNSKNIIHKQYESAIFNFFYFLTNKNIVCDIKANFHPQYLLEYFRSITNSKPDYKKQTIINKYRYIITFMDFLESNGYMDANSFNKYSLEELLINLKYNDNSDKISTLNLNNIESLINSFSLSDDISYSTYRNRLLLKLFLYAIPSIDELIDIKLSDINLDKEFININNRKIYITKSFKNDFSNYLKLRTSLKTKQPNLFLAYHDGVYNKLSFATIQYIIKTASKKCNMENITMSSIKESVIKELYKNNFTLEEISKLTGLNVGFIYKNYINQLDKSSYSSITTKIKSGKHPYSSII